ncbi:ATP synthase subunit b [Alphaproteobacteria bacterium SO-S41]|nr:ATP synthase subunit b [Alphaproteobacteria bacterium SO-S41]
MHEEPLLLQAEFWVAVGLFLFLAVIIWRKVPGVLAKMLDARAAAIATELDEAKRLREEAQALLVSYRAKAGEAETEAAAILAAARAEADRLQIEGRQSIEALIQRRTKMAEDKIAQAEASALADVKAAAADAAISAAGRLLTGRIDGAKASAISDAAIRDLRASLN